MLLLGVGVLAGEPTYDEAKAKVVELVKKFDAKKSYYLSSAFLEKDTRKEFIDPLFEALGWDVSNDEHLPLILQDTVPETRLPIDGSLKFADYGMRLDARAVFYVEAKAAFKEIDSPEYIFQARRYAWSSMRANIVVLTDFETMRVYDSRQPPSAFDATSSGMIAEFQMSYKDYPEKFQLLWDTFSKEAVKGGSLVRLLEKTGKGLERVPADQHFIADFDAKRLSLGNVLLESNPKLSDAELNAATLNILNRIVFTRILEDRDIEPTGRLRDCVMQSKEGKGSLQDILKKEFTRLHKRYNNVLFGDDPAISNLIIPEDTLRNLIMVYYPPISPYDFSAMPVGILGKVYENCLGKLLVRRDGKLQLEPKPEVRAAGGVFYSPEWVANEITRRVLEPQIKGLSPGEIASKSRIIDPACGCGAFVLSAAKYLFSASLEYYKAHPEFIGQPQEWPDAYMTDSNQLRLSIRVKAKLIEHCVWGADIDPQAVEVTRLWLYILILEEEGSPVLEEERHYKIPNKIKAQPKFTLPDLRENIICANTLSEASPIKNASFSAVIGNPPYLRLSAMNKYIPEQYKYLKEHYNFLAGGKPDLYCAFVERGIAFMQEKGRLGFLLSSKFLTAEYAKNFRMGITSQNLLNEVINFGPAKLFQEAQICTAVLILEKAPNPTFKYSKLLKNDVLNDFLKKSTLLEYEDDEMYVKTNPALPSSMDIWALPPKTKEAILQNMALCKLKFEDVSYVFSGVLTGSDHIFAVTPLESKNNTVLVKSKAEKDSFELEQGILKPFLSGEGALKRYHGIEPQKLVIWPYDIEGVLLDEDIFKEKFPLTWKYLAAHQTELKGTPWYRLLRQRDESLTFKPKLITTLTSDDKGKVGIDRIGKIISKGGGYSCCVAVKDARFTLEILLGILNSTLIYDYISLRAGSYSGDYAYSVTLVKGLPIPEYNNKTAPIYKELHDKVMKILETEDEKKRLELEGEIDALVLKLYKSAAGAQKDSSKLYRRVSPQYAPGIRQSA